MYLVTLKVKKMNRFKYLTLLMFILNSAHGQLPKTDLYLTNILGIGDDISVRGLSYLSNMNPDGYNNQPAFSSPNHLYLTTDMYDRNFTDVIKLDLKNDVYTRVTKTDSISEYSLTPNSLERHMTCIRVEKDGKSQTLRAYPSDHQDNGYRILKKMDNIGYHLWLSDTEVVLFLVTSPFTLVVSDIENETVREIATDIGRCFKQDKDGNVIFVHKIRSDLWYLKNYDPSENRTTTITKTLPDSEDFALLPDGSILMAHGSALYVYSAGGEWKEIADFYDFGLFNIKRLAVSRNQLIMVNERKK